MSKLTFSDSRTNWLIEQHGEMLRATASWLNYYGAEDGVAERFYAAADVLLGDAVTTPAAGKETR